MPRNKQFQKQELEPNWLLKHPLFSRSKSRPVSASFSGSVKSTRQRNLVCSPQNNYGDHHSGSTQIAVGSLTYAVVCGHTNAITGHLTKGCALRTVSQMILSMCGHHGTQSHSPSGTQEGSPATRTLIQSRGGGLRLLAAAAGVTLNMVRQQTVYK